MMGLRFSEIKKEGVVEAPSTLKIKKEELKDPVGMKLDMIKNMSFEALMNR